MSTNGLDTGERTMVWSNFNKKTIVTTSSHSKEDYYYYYNRAYTKKLKKTRFGQSFLRGGRQG